jgi:hypothetical protein
MRRPLRDKTLPTLDVILGPVPRICQRITNRSVADARDRPEHDGGETF